MQETPPTYVDSVAVPLSRLQVPAPAEKPAKDYEEFSRIFQEEYRTTFNAIEAQQMNVLSFMVNCRKNIPAELYVRLFLDTLEEKINVESIGLPTLDVSEASDLITKFAKLKTKFNKRYDILEIKTNGIWEYCIWTTTVPNGLTTGTVYQSRKGQTDGQGTSSSESATTPIGFFSKTSIPSVILKGGGVVVFKSVHSNADPGLETDQLKQRFQATFHDIAARCRIIPHGHLISEQTHIISVVPIYEVIAKKKQQRNPKDTTTIRIIRAKKKVFAPNLPTNNGSCNIL